MSAFTTPATVFSCGVGGEVVEHKEGMHQHENAPALKPHPRVAAQLVNWRLAQRRQRAKRWPSK